jgi:hypothetical protein
VRSLPRDERVHLVGSLAHAPRDLDRLEDARGDHTESSAEHAASMRSQPRSGQGVRAPRR